MNRMFNKKRCFTLIILGLLTMNCCSVPTSSDNIEIVDLSIHIPTSDPRTQEDVPVWIRGIWHYVNITLDGETDKLTLVLFHSENPEILDNRDETNYYEWEYDHGTWNDIQHSPEYIEGEYCHHEGKLYSFYIGLDQYAELGNWTIKLATEDEQLLSEQIYVDDAVISLTLKTMPVTINAEPFTEDEYISNEKFTVENQGNVPLRLSVSYGKYENIFSTFDFIETLKPDETRKYSILLHSRSTWKPGILTIEAGEASVRGHVQNIIPPKGIVNLIRSNVSIGLPINIYIGRRGFALESLAKDITFQYVESLDIYYDDIRDIFAYISGNGDVTVNISGKNLDIIKILSGSVEVAVPFTVQSINTSEHPITVRVKGIMPNSIALLHYTLEFGGEIRKFTTQIHVGSSKPVDETTLNITVIVAIIIFIFVGYFMYAQIKHRKK